MWISRLLGDCEHIHPQTEAPRPAPSQQLVGLLTAALLPTLLEMWKFPQTHFLFLSLNSLLIPLPPVPRAGLAMLRCWLAAWSAGLPCWAADALDH